MLEMAEIIFGVASLLPKCNLPTMEHFHRRRHWIDIGSQQAGQRVVAILSVVESWRRLAIPVRNT
jgi:hypothetical protein